MQALAENIYYEDSYAGVTLGAITTPRGTLLIDSPLRFEDARTWKAALLTQSRGTFRLMVILDAHEDRTLGNQAVEYPIIAHKKTSQVYEERTTIFKSQNTGSGAEWEHYPEVNSNRWAKPSITFTKSLYLNWSGPEIQIEHHPGPAPGASWVHIPSEKVLFVGDAVTLNQPPFLARANLEIWHQTLNLLASRQFYNYTIISGRSGPITIEDVREHRKLLKSIRGRLETQAKRNTEPEEIPKMVPAILEKISYPKEMEEFYSQRLEYGLRAYYIRHFQGEN